MTARRCRVSWTTGQPRLVSSLRGHQPACFMEQAAFVEHTGNTNAVPYVQVALERAEQIGWRFPGVGEDAARDLERVAL